MKQRKEYISFWYVENSYSSTYFHVLYSSNIMIEIEHNNKVIVKFEGDEIRKLIVNDKDYFIAKGVFV